jgi:hypothetical protein
MPGTLEAVDAHRIAADALGLERVANRRALVNDLHARLLQRLHERLRAAAGGLDDLHAAVDDDAHVLVVRRRHEHRQNREIHAEGLVGHLVAARDLLLEIGRRRLREAGDDAEPAGVGDGRGHLGVADVMHAALNDGVLDAEKLGDAGLHWSCPLV